MDTASKAAILVDPSSRKPYWSCAAADDLADAGGVCPAPAGFDEVSHLRKSGFDEVSHLRNHAILVGVAESRPIAEIRAAKLVSDPST